MTSTKGTYGRFDTTHLKKMEEGILLFNRQRFWECHEALEEQWLEDRGDPARYAYWAVIQVACVLLHCRDENPAGAEGLRAKAVEKFDKCIELGVVTPLLEKNLSWGELKKLLFAIPPDAPLRGL